ncbi:MAG: DUF4339 domain-containing protein [Pirellulales bacterium]|jgi:hypothetical protein|nr:DUF4339 domain-containing protein [Pirellulales bacterium]
MEWYYADRNDDQVGPVDQSEIDNLIKTGVITQDTEVWRDGMADWIAAGTTELKGSFSTSGPPPRIPSNNDVVKVQAGELPKKGRIKVFPGQAKHVDDTALFIKQLLENEKLEAQLMEDGKNRIIQARQEPAQWKKYVKKALGLEVAATVFVAPDGNNLELVVGAGRWLDKAAIGAVAWFIAPALLGTTGWGIYMQKKLFSKIEKEVEQFLLSKN